MHLINGQPFNFSSYVQEKPSLTFECDWDEETFDWCNPDVYKIIPKTFNQPASFFRYLGRLRNQPVFDRFFVPPAGRFVIKLLESRLYHRCVDFVFQQCTLRPSAVSESRYNWSRGLGEPPVKPVLKTLCRLFNEGNTLIVYNINTQTVHGVLVAGQYPKPHEAGKRESAVSWVSHCPDRFAYVMQTLDLDRFLKVHLLLVDRKSPENMADAFTYGLMKGLVAWRRFCLPKSGVKCIIVHPERASVIPLYKRAGFGAVKHNEKTLLESDVLPEACFLVKVLCYEEDTWNTHKFHGIIAY